MSKNPVKRKVVKTVEGDYSALLDGIAELLETARRTSVRTVNALMTATYWDIGRRIVEHEQGGEKRAEYGKALLERLSTDLSQRFGRGFARPNLIRFRQFYQAFPNPGIRSTVSNESSVKTKKRSTVSNESALAVTQVISSPQSLVDFARAFPLPWSHYVLLISQSRSTEAFEFYHAEALRGGWSVRQLQRQLDSQLYERTALSRNKASILAKSAKPAQSDALSADEEVRDPLVLEFLGLRDEYSESDLEEALIRQLEVFLLELGNDFAFIGRQRRLRIDDEWYRVDLLFFHRRLRCLVIVDLKLGRFTHADAGQMHMYLNYAREHWTLPVENPPVGVILCSGKSEALVHYATDALPNKLIVREYLTALPDERTLAAEIERSRKDLEQRK